MMPCSRRLEDADALLRGRFRFYGEMVDVPDGVSVFDLRAALARLARGAARFCLAAAAGGGGRRGGARAGHQPDRPMGQALRPLLRAGWAPHVMARRLMHIFSHGRLVVLEFRHDVALATVRHPARTGPGCWSASPAKRRTACRGWKRPRRWRCRACAWTIVPSGWTSAWRGWKRKSQRQILPDGGHVSRSPEDLLDAYRMSDDGDGRAGGGE